MSSNSGIDRRQFLAGSAGALLLAMLGAEEIRAQEKAPAGAPAAAGPPVHCGIIGLGVQGRALMQALARTPNAPVLGVCDNYKSTHKRALDIAPKATAVDDYRRILDNADIEAVFIATPTHLHRQIAIDAVAAGKHVYCEAPIANTIEDAKAIALAGKGSKKVWQAGLIHRADPISVQVLKFLDASAMGKVAQVRAQWHKRTSWRRAASTPERERDLNWRLSKATSTGLAGECGVHSLDLASWYLGALPVSATGMGSVLSWADGRDVPDTIQCIVEYPGGINFTYDATLANSFDGSYDVFMGTESAIFMKEGRAWMVKEADATALGWEVYARKEKFGYETGIALVADATKQLEAGKKPGEQTAPKELSDQTMTDNLVLAFLNAIRAPEGAAGAGPLAAYQSTVAAIKTNEAIVNGTKVTIDKQAYQLA